MKPTFFMRKEIATTQWHLPPLARETCGLAGVLHCGCGLPGPVPTTGCVWVSPEIRAGPIIAHFCCRKTHTTDWAPSVYHNLSCVLQVLFNTHSTAFHSQRMKMKLREGKWFAQGRTAGKEWSQHSATRLSGCLVFCFLCCKEREALYFLGLQNYIQRREQIIKRQNISRSMTVSWIL